MEIGASKYSEVWPLDSYKTLRDNDHNEIWYLNPIKMAIN